jgi:uncharacterized protein (DUF169 family)
MPDHADIEATLTRLLGLRRPPVAVTFCTEEPAGMRKFAGQAPSGCTFWKLAADGEPFYTVPSDHYNCAIGSYTHNIQLPKERAGELEGVLGFMSQIGYVKREEVPQIPRWSQPPAAVAYARLEDATLPPDVVVVAGSARAAMLLAEASMAAGASSGLTLPRPTCMAIPAAHAGGTTMSLGCIGNRVYTDLPDDELYSMIRGRDLESVVEALGRIVSANEQLTSYHEGRKSTLLRTVS